MRIGQVNRISSIADLISSRYGKSNTLAVMVTLMAVIGTTPHIALQLKAVTTSFEVVSGGSGALLGNISGDNTGTDPALWVAVGMALFTILFGTRNLDANEQHPGVVAAIAFEAHGADAERAADRRLEILAVLGPAQRAAEAVVSGGDANAAVERPFVQLGQQGPAAFPAAEIGELQALAGRAARGQRQARQEGDPCESSANRRPGTGGF